MPRRKQNNQTPTAGELEKRLTLVNWFVRKIGYTDNAEMLGDLKDSSEKWTGKHPALQRILLRENFPDEMRGVLSQLDDNLRGDLQKINRRRRDKITLKYFQYLAALTSEYLLHRLSLSHDNLVAEINKFAKFPPYHPVKLNLFSEPIARLNKLAFWMATGGGKTLLLHLHYLQYLRYADKLGAPDNVLLITPNETLTRQHIAEMELSSIPCAYYLDGGLGGDGLAVKVIEITKLKIGGKKGRGVTVPVEHFGGRNLVFVDEGHKGTGGDVFFEAKNALAKRGFSFEYSATFGQALKAADRDARTREYAQSIAFDYSYRYFYGDGYGKDFGVLNLTGEVAEDKRDLLMLGNLLSFCQQIAVYQKTKPGVINDYHLSPPLMLMLGATVIGDNTAAADVVQLARFLQKTASNENGWLDGAIKKLINGESGIGEPDVFADSFNVLKGKEPEQIRALLLKTVFRAERHGGLQIRRFKNAKNEMGIKIGDNADYFAVIYVGDVNKLEKLLAENITGAETAEEAISAPLFSSVNEPSSAVNILIGAKKFMEGWSSWRVCSMGLLNVGKSEGAQIIQLFGRGVRLKGRGFSLKRAAAGFSADAKSISADQLNLLETLNVFAVRANFMSRFRDYLEREGVATAGATVAVPIKRNELFLQNNLPVPDFPDKENFNRAVVLDDIRKVVVRINRRVKVQQFAGAAGGEAMQNEAEPVEFNEVAFNKIDWETLRLRLLENKRADGCHNLVIRAGELRPILKNCCRILADPGIGEAIFDSAEETQSLAFEAASEYAEKMFNGAQRRWETAEMKYKTLDGQHPNFRNYTVHAPRDATEKILRLIGDIEKMNGNLYRMDDVNEPLPRVHYERHLYQPLLLNSKRVKISPPPLEKSEADFVRAMIEHAPEFLRPGQEAFLLRNLSRGQGIGFFEEAGVYPDFILWVKNGDKMRVVFVEPHGMRQENAGSFRTRLHETLREVSAQIARRDKKWTAIEMDSYIVSATSFDDLSALHGGRKLAEYYEDHILFRDTEDRKRESVKIILNGKTP